MTKKLEKWYLWDRETVIPDVEKILRFDGYVFKNAAQCVPLGVAGDENNLYIAYTLGEQVESKRGAK